MYSSSEKTARDSSSVGCSANPGIKPVWAERPKPRTAEELKQRLEEWRADKAAKSKPGISRKEWKTAPKGEFSSKTKPDNGSRVKGKWKETECSASERKENMQQSLQGGNVGRKWKVIEGKKRSLKEEVNASLGSVETDVEECQQELPDEQLMKVDQEAMDCVEDGTERSVEMETDSAGCNESAETEVAEEEEEQQCKNDMDTEEQKVVEEDKCTVLDELDFLNNVLENAQTNGIEWTREQFLKVVNESLLQERDESEKYIPAKHKAQFWVLRAKSEELFGNYDAALRIFEQASNVDSEEDGFEDVIHTCFNDFRARITNTPYVYGDSKKTKETGEAKETPVKANEEAGEANEDTVKGNEDIAREDAKEFMEGTGAGDGESENEKFKESAVQGNDALEVSCEDSAKANGEAEVIEQSEENREVEANGVSRSNDVVSEMEEASEEKDAEKVKEETGIKIVDDTAIELEANKENFEESAESVNKKTICFGNTETFEVDDISNQKALEIDLKGSVSDEGEVFGNEEDSGEEDEDDIKLLGASLIRYCAITPRTLNSRSRLGNETALPKEPCVMMTPVRRSARILSRSEKKTGENKIGSLREEGKTDSVVRDFSVGSLSEISKEVKVECVPNEALDGFEGSIAVQNNQSS
eukprot:Nk52_evm15s675 gene=Nk52_evmTU15s675